eukprot:8965468-Pyramimonas_sp.AAC.1
MMCCQDRPAPSGAARPVARPPTMHRAFGADAAAPPHSLSQTRRARRPSRWKPVGRLMLLGLQVVAAVLG